jgi:hypothetical protein
MGSLFQFIGVVFFCLSCALLYANEIDHAIVGMLVANFVVLIAIFDSKHG